MFQNAIVRTPSSSLIAGLTNSSHLGKPDYAKAILQHQAYIEALTQCGVEVTVLPALEEFPDSCFVEDVALLTDELALLTRPGAPSRQGEVNEIEATIKHFYRERIARIQAPATLEAGDVLQVGKHFFIGLSARTNALGAQQMIEAIKPYGYTGSTVLLQEFLHLKTGVSYLDKEYLLVSGELSNRPEFAHLNTIEIPDSEAYAANCIMVNGTVLMPSEHPKTQKIIQNLGLPLIELEVSEFRKVDGGLSCLSLRF